MLSKKTLLNLLPIILILLLASILRFLWLDKVPVAIGGDELTYVFNAKAMFLTGSDISGTWNPLSAFIFHYPAYTTPQAELPYFLLAPIVGATPLSLFDARITFAILSILSVLLIYLIAKELFSREVGIIAGFIAAINPWLIYIGRTDYEQVPVTLFFLIGIYILLKAKDWKILWSVPILFLAFYSYIGTKLIFFPVVLIVCFYAYIFINKKKYLKQYLLVLLASFLLILFFALTVSHGSSRLGEFFLPNSPILTEQVNAVRKVTMQTPLSNIFENKMTEYSKTIFTKAFDTTSFSYLFLMGDNFFFIRHGLFYILDALFLLLGLAAAYKRKSATFLFLASLAFVAILPQVFYKSSLGNFAPHIALLFPILIILIAVGIDEVIGFYKNKYFFYGISALIGLLYLGLLLSFLNTYFFQNTLQGNFDFPVRLLAKYVSLANQNKQPVLIYSPAVPDVVKKYFFYTDSYNKNTVSLVKSLYKTSRFNFDNIQVLGCNNTIDPSKVNSVIVYDFNCGALKKDYNRIVIPRLSDGGQSYDIFNDNLCSKYNLKRYPANLSISDFAIENQSAQKFCETFITNP